MPTFIYMMTTPEDISRERPTIAKFWQPFSLLHPRNNRAIAKVDEFESIDIEKIQKHFGIEIKAIILDIDECVAPHHGEIMPANERKILELNDEYRVIGFSNMKKTDRYAKLEEAGISIHMSHFPKPDGRGFLEACEALEVKPEETVMIGDNFITDGGANRVGIHFIKVKPIWTLEPRWKKTKRMFTLGARKWGDICSGFYDMLLRRDVMRDADFKTEDS